MKIKSRKIKNARSFRLGSRNLIPRGGSWSSLHKLGSAILSGNVRGLLSERTRAVADLLAEHGNSVIKSVSVRRSPVLRILEWIIKKTTNYENAVDQLGYDQVFHLAADFTTADGKLVTIQKNSRVDVDYGPPPSEPLAETLQIPISNGKTFQQLFETCEKKFGNPRLYSYDARTTNCQVFVGDLLDGLDALSAEAADFIYQSAEKLLTVNEGKFVRFLTDSIGVVDYVIKGGKQISCDCG